MRSNKSNIGVTVYDNNNIVISKKLRNGTWVRKKVIKVINFEDSEEIDVRVFNIDEKVNEYD